MKSWPMPVLSIPSAAVLPRNLTDDNTRRTVYGFVSRRKLDGTLALFDFPNPNVHQRARMDTNVPLQRLFFLNSDFMQRRIEVAGRPAASARRMTHARSTRLTLCFSAARPPTKSGSWGWSF